MAVKHKTAATDTGPQVAGTVELVPLAEISDDGHNHRIASSAKLKKAEEGRVQALAETMRVDGLLQPILVYRDGGGRLVRVFGSRRCAAAAVLGWEKIPAKVLAAIPTPAELQRMRATENLERKDLSPAERALAVWECVEAARMGGTLQAGGMEAAMAAVAAERGIKPSEVLDCCYVVNRLTPKVRELMAAGLINLGQARVLATCGGESQESHAQTVADAADGVDWQGKHTGEAKIIAPADIAGWIANEQHSLKVVPWELGQAMKTGVKECSVCLGCTHNTATDVTLFGQAAQTDKEGAGFCRLAEGFAAKQALVKKEIDKAVMAIEKQVKAKKVDKEDAAAAGSVREAVPVFVKTGSAQRVIRKELGLNPEKATGSDKAAAGEAKKEKVDPKVEALRKWEKAFVEWQKKCLKALDAWMKHEPLGRLAWLVMANADVAFPAYEQWRRGKNGLPEPEKAISAGAAKALDLAAAVAGGDGTLATMQAAAELLPWPRKDEWDATLRLDDLGPELIGRVFETFGVDLPGPAPRVADFLPKAEPAKAEQLKPIDIKTAKVLPAAKAGTCRRCGCTEAKACPSGCRWADKEKTLCDQCVSGARLILGKEPYRCSTLELNADQVAAAYSGDTLTGKACKLRDVVWVYGNMPFACVGTSGTGAGGTSHFTLVRLVPETVKVPADERHAVFKEIASTPWGMGYRLTNNRVEVTVDPPTASAKPAPVAKGPFALGALVCFKPDKSVGVVLEPLDKGVRVQLASGTVCRWRTTDCRTANEREALKYSEQQADHATLAAEDDAEEGDL